MAARGISSSAAIVMVLASISSADAAEPGRTRVGVAPLAFTGEGAEAIDDSLLDNVVDHDTGAVRLSSRCTDTTCRVEQARRAGVTHIVELDVEAELNDYRMELSVFDAEGNRLHNGRFACEICTPQDAAAATAREAAALRPVLGLAAAEPEATAAPETAEPVVAPTPASSTDASRDRGAAGSKKNRTLQIAGWSTAGVGLVGVVAGSVLLVLDDRPYKSGCTGEGRDVNGECEFLYDTVTGGATLVAVGGAALITGIALAVVGHKRARADRSRVRAAIGPRAIQLEVKF